MDFQRNSNLRKEVRSVLLFSAESSSFWSSHKKSVVQQRILEKLKSKSSLDNQIKGDSLIINVEQVEFHIKPVENLSNSKKLFLKSFALVLLFDAENKSSLNCLISKCRNSKKQIDMIPIKMLVAVDLDGKGNSDLPLETCETLLKEVGGFKFSKYPLQKILSVFEELAKISSYSLNKYSSLRNINSKRDTQLLHSRRPNLLPSEINRRNHDLGDLKEWFQNHNLDKQYAVLIWKAGYNLRRFLSLNSIQELLKLNIPENEAMKIYDQISFEIQKEKAFERFKDYNIWLEGVENCFERLGSGKFGDIYRGKWGGEIVALKSIHNIAGANIDELFREGKALRDLNHPKVVKFYGLSKLDNTIYLVIEFMPRGSLEKYLRENKYEEFSLKLSFSIDIAQGMQFLETKSYIHRDLACRNCLLSENMNVRISDLGLARQADIYEMHSNSAIPFQWTAPEALTRRTYTTKSDVWNFGVCLWEMMVNCEYVPFWELETKIQLLERIKEREDKGFPMLEKPKDCPDEFFDIMRQCWEIDPEKRPSFKELVSSLQLLQESTEKVEETNTTDNCMDNLVLLTGNTGICQD